MKTTFEAWEKVFKTKQFDTTVDLHFITADEIKAITGQEARIMAKVDFSKDLPEVFKRNGYFLLPVKNGNYAIVRGEGFHLLEDKAALQEYESKIDFPLTTAGRGQSEMQYLDHSYNTGVLEQVVGVGPLYQSIRGREYSRKFSFRVGQTTLDTESVQIEVDSGLEGKDSIVLAEAKVGTPEDFIIRQLFYPYRHFQIVSPQKKIVPVFLTYDLADQTYNIWVYKFTDPNDYNSIELERNHTFKILTPTPLRMEDISPKGLVTYKDLIPQANDLDKVIELVFKVSEGVNRYQAVAQHFGFDERQSSYYREAAEALGLVTSEAGIYQLTETGKKFVSLDAEKRNIFFVELLSDFHLVQNATETMKKKGVLTRTDIEEIIAKNSDLTGTTIGRRASSLVSWFNWIAEHTSSFAQTEKGFELKA